MIRQRIKYKNKQVSTYKNYYITQMTWQGTKVGIYILVSNNNNNNFHNCPLWVCKKERRKKISFSPIFNNIYKYHHLHPVCF